MRSYNVPFVENPDDMCVPASIGMVLGYFMTEKNFTMDDLIKLTGYRKGFGSWPTESMANLANLGFKTRWIEDFDHAEFIKNPKHYLSTILDEESLNWQVEHSDLELEASRIKAYLDSGHVIEHRKGTKEDITELLDGGWLVRLEVNASTLADKAGYDGHSVLVVGYDKAGVTLHNPDGTNGNKPNQKVSWEKLKQAWKEFGGSYSIYAFRR